MSNGAFMEEVAALLSALAHAPAGSDLIARARALGLGMAPSKERYALPYDFMATPEMETVTEAEVRSAIPMLDMRRGNARLGEWKVVISRV
jgi:hypothetical protein